MQMSPIFPGPQRWRSEAISHLAHRRNRLILLISEDLYYGERDSIKYPFFYLYLSLFISPFQMKFGEADDQDSEELFGWITTFISEFERASAEIISWVPQSKLGKLNIVAWRVSATIKWTVGHCDSLLHMNGFLFECNFFNDLASPVLLAGKLLRI